MTSASGSHRFVQAAIAFLALLLCGLVYAWSLFVEPLEAEFGWTRSQTSLIFTISLITFSLGMLAAGWLHSRGLSKRALFAAAALVAAGFAICSQAQSLMVVYVGYGVLVGLSSGFCSNTVISMALRWYPDKQGFASGALLMGIGCGPHVAGCSAGDIGQLSACVPGVPGNRPLRIRPFLRRERAEGGMSNFALSRKCAVSGLFNIENAFIIGLKAAFCLADVSAR